ncbi:MAG: hypothetical protein AAFP98_11190 [Pseudomonadota bacterium]
MTTTSAQKVHAAYEGLLRLAEHETPWEGDKETAPSSYMRFPPVDSILSDLDDMSDVRSLAL